MYNSNQLNTQQHNHNRTLSLSKLEKWEDFRTIDWINYLEYPEYTLKEISHFLHT